MSGFRTPLCFACIAALTACREEPPAQLLVNSCLTDLNCSGDGVFCELSTLMCVRPKTIEPYQVVLQVQPEQTRMDVPDAGSVTLLAQTAFDLGILDGGINDKTLEVPEALRSRGRVRGVVDGALQLIESELTLLPRMDGAQLGNTVVNSAQMGVDTTDAGTNVEALLDPTLSYDLRVQPLLNYSKALPPYHSTSPFNPKQQKLDVEYPEISELKARLTSSSNSFEPTSWAGYRVRLEDKATGRVISSIEQVQGPLLADGGTQPGGMFTLHAERKVFEESSKSLLAVDLSPLGFPRWQVKMMLDGTRVQGGATINLPQVPQLVPIDGTVTDVETKAPLPNAGLHFVSKFPVKPDYFGSANWCTLRRDNLPSPELACSAQLDTRADANGRFEIALIPGEYDVYVQPDRVASPDRTTVSTGLVVENVNNEPGFMTQSIEVRMATQYNGVVGTISQQPMPNITVNGRALGLYDPKLSTEEYRELAKYNRSMTTVTDADGEFSLYPDVGRYDFSVEPPPESGFAWMFCPDYSIKQRDRRGASRVQLRPFFPPTPVIIAGRVEHRGVALANARIEAYAIWNVEPPRLLLVARGTSDAQGKFRLPMPPQLPPTDRNDAQSCPIKPEPPEAEDAGLSTLDSGLFSMDGGTHRDEAGAASPDSESPAR